MRGVEILKKIRKSKKTEKVIEGMLFIVAAIIALMFLFPMVYTVISSLKPLEDITSVPMRWIPREIRLRNFIEPFVEKNFGIYFLNSIFVTVTVTFSSLFFCSLAGYSLTKFDYKGKNFFFILVLMTMMVPIEITIVPLAIIVRKLGWMNSYPGLIVPVAITPFGIFWMRQFMITIPKDYAEAGRIDGLSEFGIFMKLILPLCKPALGALAIFTFMGNWNSLIWPLIVASKDQYRTITVGLVAFEGEFFTPYNHLFAMSVVAVLPTLVIFLILRTKLIKGLAMVGIKG